MLKFHASIHRGSPENPDSLTVTFDQAFAALSRFERLFIEPDGSFVWTGSTADGQPWQVDGNLIDRGDRLAYVELQGRCTVEQFEQLLAALDWPQATLIFQLPRRGIFLEEADFRQLA